MLWGLIHPKYLILDVHNDKMCTVHLMLAIHILGDLPRRVLSSFRHKVLNIGL